jgi:hypothetical protein
VRERERVDHLFRRGDDPKARASQAHPALADVSRVIVNRKENAATETAALITIGNNKLRHETLQRFMLSNLISCRCGTGPCTFSITSRMRAIKIATNPQRERSQSLRWNPVTNDRVPNACKRH